MLDQGRNVVFIRKDIWILITAAPEKAQGKRRSGVEETAPTGVSVFPRLQSGQLGIRLMPL